jgi:proteasome lid subunit RPN8/RPN11
MADDGIEITTGLEFAQPVEKVIPTADAAKKVEPKGVVQPEDLHIFLSERILREVVDWSKSDIHHELGGVFVGDLYSYKGLPYLEIAGYIRAQHYEHTAASFRFTHDSWSAISREREKRFGDKMVVGWHHTHPGYGIFLSGTDMFSHRNFFNLPWMFALVVDPKAGSLGFFQWNKGMRDVRPCGFFFVR